MLIERDLTEEQKQRIEHLLARGIFSAQVWSDGTIKILDNLNAEKVIVEIPPRKKDRK